MNSPRKHLLASVGSAAQMAALVLTTLGIASLVIGLFVMPSLVLSEPHFYAALLGLVAFMVLCFGAGQLVLIQHRLADRA